MQLGELITKRRAEMGGPRGLLTLRELEERARAAGYTLAGGTIAAFVNHPLDEPPKRRTMEALAVALQVPYADVVNAVGESMGGGSVLEQVAGDEYIRAYITASEGLTDAQRAALVDVVRTVASSYAAAEATERNRPASTRGAAPDSGSR